MSDNPDRLKEHWLGGQDNRLCAREQAKAWALRELWLEQKESTYGLNEYVASKLRKNKDGLPKGPAPTGAALKEFFEKIDKDEDWFPGKHNGAKRHHGVL